MRYLLIALLLIVVLTPVLADSPGTASAGWTSRPSEIRAVWMDRRSIPATEQGIRRLIRSYAGAGINLVHPEVIYNGYSAYPSSYLTRQDLWHGIDMLGILIDEAHKRGIEVHPWVWVFRTGNASDHGGILKAHPDWVAVNKDGGTLTPGNSYWLCPSVPGARRLLLGAFRELAEKYPIDGIELDYIRFEDQSPVPYCYNDSCRSKFQAEHGIDPMCIEPFTKPVLDWQLWREELINSFVAQVSDETRKVRPTIRISAAVGSIPDIARVSYLQDWPHWAANKWVDFLAPMDYTADVQHFARRQDASAKAIANTALLAPGIGLHLFKGTDTMLDEIEVARSKSVSGVTLFASESLKDDRLKALAEGPFNGKAQLPARDPVEGVKILARSASKRVGDGASSQGLSEADHELTGASTLVKYAEYSAKEVGYVPPTAPPIFIPDVIRPLPSADVPFTDSAPALDGRLDDAAWQKAGHIGICVTNLGAEARQLSDVMLLRDASNLYVGMRCREPRLDRMKVAVSEHDGPVFTDDSVEILIDPSSKSRDYYHFAVNAIGTRFEQYAMNPSWNGEWRAATGREVGAWTAEIAIPFAPLKVTPTAGSSWRANFCRNRTTTMGDPENSCWSATYGSYHTPIRFGILKFDR